MKKKYSIIISIFMLICLFGCALNASPSAKVKELMSKYNNKDSAILSELEDYIAESEVDEKHIEDYKEVYIRQYEDLKYTIKDEMIDGDNATVTAEIEVYDYYKKNQDVEKYIVDNNDSFTENNIYNPIKALEYKINELKNTNDKITYTIIFNLTKINDKWTIDTLSNEELEKIHGTFAH